MADSQPQAPKLFRVISGNPDPVELAALDKLLHDMVAKSSGPQERERNAWGTPLTAAARFNPTAFNTVVYR